MRKNLTYNTLLVATCSLSIIFLLRETAFAYTGVDDNTKMPFIQAAQERFKNTVSRRESSTYYMPGSGIQNNNGTIGPFCCTGETAIVYTEEGYPAGYLYFFGWRGQAYNTNNGSIAPGVEILISGLNDLSNPNSGQAENVIYFPGDWLIPGQSLSGVAGSLYYTVTVERVRTSEREGQTYFYMGSLIIKVKVQAI